MDEASLAFHLSGVVGTVLSTKPFKRVMPGDRARLSHRRGNVTYMASICSDPAFNKCLPQILLGNANCFPKRVLVEVEGELGPNIYAWRENSSWNNRALMRRYIALLCDCLGEVMQEREVYLVLDMASCHLHPSVLKLAMKKRVRIILVPAGMTGVLQPLDSHVFRQFRAKMQEGWLERKSATDDGQVSLQTWFKIVNDAIDAIVVSKSWRHAFERVRILSSQSLISPKLLKALAWESCPEIPNKLPAPGQAARMFPRRSKTNVAMWVQWKSGVSFTPIHTLD